ncbi:hypothetical protein IscW_ISCW014418, partial [Ixodes scapularis]
QSARPRRAPDEGHGPSNPGLVGGLTRSPRPDAHTCPDTPGVATSRNGHGRRAGRRSASPPPPAQKSGRGASARRPGEEPGAREACCLALDAARNPVKKNPGQI